MMLQQKKKYNICFTRMNIKSKMIRKILFKLRYFVKYQHKVRCKNGVQIDNKFKLKWTFVLWGGYGFKKNKKNFNKIKKIIRNKANIIRWYYYFNISNFMFEKLI